MNFISGQFLDKLHVIPEAQAVTLDFKSPVTYETKPPKVQNEEGSGHLDNIHSTEASETTSPGYISVLFHLQEHYPKILSHLESSPSSLFPMSHLWKSRRDYPSSVRPRPLGEKSGFRGYHPSPNLSVWADNERGQSLACFTARAVGRRTPQPSVYADARMCVSEGAEPCSCGVAARFFFFFSDGSHAFIDGRPARPTGGVRALIVWCWHEDWDEKKNTHTHTPRDAKTSHLSFLNDSLEAVMSHSESTLHSGFAGLVCWQDPQLYGCQSMCQEKMVSLLNLVALGHKTGVWMLLMNQLNAHQARLCQAPPDTTAAWVGLILSTCTFLPSKYFDIMSGEYFISNPPPN